MGANMVRRLIKGGHEGVVYDRSEKMVKDLIRGSPGRKFGGGSFMRMEVLSNAEAVAQRAAAVIAEEARAAVAARGRFLMAVSGGKTPWIMLRALADEAVP